MDEYPKAVAERFEDNGRIGKGSLAFEQERLAYHSPGYMKSRCLSERLAATLQMKTG